MVFSKFVLLCGRPALTPSPLTTDASPSSLFLALRWDFSMLISFVSQTDRWWEMSISFIGIITRKKASGCYVPKSVLQWCLWSPWMRLETEARGGLLSKEDCAFNDAPTMCAYNVCLQWCALPIFNDRIQTGHENWGTGAVLRKMGVTPDSGLASLWLLLLFSEQCSAKEQHPSALDHLGRTRVSWAIFYIF